MKNSANKVMKAGVVGLGQIGGGIAICLAKKKRPLTVYDINKNATKKLMGVPDSVASPAEVASKSDVVFIAVVDTIQVNDVLCGENAILAGAHENLTIVLISTIPLSDIRKFVALARNVGVPLLDCGVTGGPVSQSGGLGCMIGGDAGDVARILPVIEDFSEEIYHMGETGAGMIAKIARNMIHYTVWRAGYEGGILAKKGGLNVDKFIKMVEKAANKPGASVTTWIDASRIIPSERMEKNPEKLKETIHKLHDKSMYAAKELAIELGVKTPASDAARENGSETYGIREI